MGDRVKKFRVDIEDIPIHIEARTRAEAFKIVRNLIEIIEQDKEWCDL